jgi:O-antigen/teichoic acid export membrane protein
MAGMAGSASRVRHGPAVVRPGLIRVVNLFRNEVSLSMLRQIVFYLPANIIPAACSLLLVFAYTRVLTPEAFGVYSLVFSGVLFAQNALFFAVPIAITRFHPRSILSDREVGFLKAAYTLFYILAAAVVAVCVIVLPLSGLEPTIRHAAWLGVPILLTRAAVGMNQAVNRSANLMARYVTIECAHAVLGIAIGLALIPEVGPSADAVLLGLLIAASVCAVVDLGRLLLPLRWRVGLDREALLHLISYSWPLVGVAIAASVLQLSDRFLLGSFGDTGLLGVYAVAYSLVDRPTSVICSAITTATFPIAVQMLEQQGREAGRIQAGKNGAVLLALALPACAGLALTAPQIAATLVGSAFREGVTALIPIMCFTALLQGVRAHFIDHAFHLAGRSSTMMWSYGPAAIANVVLNLVLIPRYGMLGAAWSGLASQSLAVAVGWAVGQRVFPLWVPLDQVMRIVACVALMAAVLLSLEFANSWFGLLEAVSVGGCIFVMAAMLFNAGEVRSRLIRFWIGTAAGNSA